MANEIPVRCCMTCDHARVPGDVAGKIECTLWSNLSMCPSDSPDGPMHEHIDESRNIMRVADPKPGDLLHMRILLNAHTTCGYWDGNASIIPHPSEMKR